jgi:Asp-tRNA(Asn)/Glu-tRNA(Gln) amidotransferase A subunit family amidase
MAGYPNVIIPLDVIDGLPVGLSFIGTKWSDKSLIQYAYSFEQLNGFDYKPREYFKK